jgi:hypothetical protein
MVKWLDEVIGAVDEKELRSGYSYPVPWRLGRRWRLLQEPYTVAPARPKTKFPMPVTIAYTAGLVCAAFVSDERRETLGLIWT